MHILFESVSSILPLKNTSEKALARLGINNLRDLLFYKPSSYIINDISPNLTQLKDGQLIQSEIIIDEVIQSKSRRGPIKITASNETGSLLLVFFNKIPPFIWSKLTKGSRHIIAGKVQLFDHYFQITHPEFILKKSLNTSVLPIYPLTYGLINKQLCGYIRDGINAFELAAKARSAFAHKSEENSEGLYIKELIADIKQIHLLDAKASPVDIELKMSEAISRLAAKELFANQGALVKLKNREKSAHGRSFSIFKELQQQILDKLEFALTEAQNSAISQIEQDQKAAKAMMRLLQGDVGCGKTLVALMTMINVTKSGAQCALMVPTDLLSQQHYNFFAFALADTGIKVGLLTGKTKPKDRKRIRQELEDGSINILIGTHALFQESINFRNLGYIVIDEQHRFGVEQRLDLIKKAITPDVLVMTATPIPRSLTLTMFGDMDVSQIKEKPKNRVPIITTTISASKKVEVIHSLIKRINAKEKIYWICPLIDQTDKALQDEANEDSQAYADVMARYNELLSYYPDQVGFLHGKMKAQEKDDIMQSFKEDAVKILVSTTVIEVGIDIPDSTLIIIENAEKFGLAQLHQLRGRVGRGNLQSYCMLMYNYKRLSALAKRRLEIMKESTDGFYIAEQDLILRGSGEILGTRQSGIPEFYFADLGRDTTILLSANKLATNITASTFIDFQIRLFDRNRTDLTNIVN